MEAVPRLPMIAFELKTSPEYVDFGPVLKQYIRDNYGEDPADYNKACSELEQLRQSAVHVSHDFMGCSTLKKYYAQLQFLQGRFPMTDGGQAAMPFTWEDIFMVREVTLADIKFEQASVLYNIGALHSILGSMETRTNADSMKVACTHFQCASGAFEYLRDHFGSAMMSLDFSHDLLTFHINLMLAQAQECILEKSMIDSRKSSITAKVAAQIVEFNNLAMKSLEPAYKEGIVPSRKYKEWKKRMELKSQFYECITNFYMGKQSEDQQKWGECLAYYTTAFNKLNECIKQGKSEGGDIQESFRFAMDVIGGKYQSAKKDNDFVYHDKVPDLASLPEVKGASLVKGITFNPSDPEVSGPDLFQKLVPMEAHEASSLYSEEKAKLIRRVCGTIEEKNAELVQFMSSLNIDQSTLSYEPENLPQSLLEKCAAVSVKPNAIKDLVNAMTGVSNVATEVEMSLNEISKMLEEDGKEEEEFQKQFGKRAEHPMFENIRKELNLFSEGHKKGSKSNNDLHKAMNAHITNLRLLGGPIEDIKNALPSKDKEKTPEDETIVKELQRLISKVDEMKSQRSLLEEQFRTEVQKDDITHRIVTQEGSNKQVMFEQEILKHKKLEEIIQQNLTAQDNILRALTDANVRYAEVRRKVGDVAARREVMIKDLINSFDVYEDLLAKSQKGQEFYRKLESNVSKLLTRCRGLCKIQAEEREQIINRHKPKEPPPRPMAPKPDNTAPDPMICMGASDNALPTATIPPQPVAALNTIPGFEGPKLKDYLPFMKPKTFGKDREKKSNARSAPENLGSQAGRAPDLPQNLPNQGDLSSYLPRADQQNPSIPQVPAVAGSQQPVIDQSASFSQQMSQFSARPPFNPSHVDVGQSYSSPGQSPSPSPALPSPAHSPVPRQQYRSQSLSPAPQGRSQNPTQDQEYHSLPAGYGQGYLTQSQTSQNQSLSQGQVLGYQSVSQSQIPGHYAQTLSGQVQQPGPQNTMDPNRQGTTQLPVNYNQSDFRQQQQSVDPRISGGMVSASQQIPQSSQPVPTGQQYRSPASSSSTQKTNISYQMPSNQLQHSQVNTGVSQIKQQVVSYSQGPAGQQETGGYIQQAGQYYQNQMKLPHQNVSSQQPQQFTQPHQSMGLVNQSQQQQQVQPVSSIPSGQQQQNMYSNQQFGSSGYMTNPNTRRYMTNQVDQNNEGRSSPANLHLGLPYASTHQSRPAQSFSHGDDKSHTVNSKEHNLSYGHPAHSHHAYAPLKPVGPALQNTKWDAESQMTQQKLDNVEKDPRYQKGSEFEFLHLGMPYASTHQSMPSTATSHISTMNPSHLNSVPLLTYGHLGYGPLPSTSYSATNLSQSAATQAIRQQQPQVQYQPQQQALNFQTGMPYTSTSQSMSAMSMSKMIPTQTPVLLSSTAQSHMYMAGSQATTQTATLSSVGNSVNYPNVQQGLQQAPQQIYSQPQQQGQQQYSVQSQSQHMPQQRSDNGQQGQSGSFQQSRQPNFSQQMNYQTSGYLQQQQNLSSYPGAVEQPQQMSQGHSQQLTQQPQQLTQQPQQMTQQQQPQQMTQQQQSRMPYQGMMPTQVPSSQQMPSAVMPPQHIPQPGHVQQQQQQQWMSSGTSSQYQSSVSGSYQSVQGASYQVSTGSPYQSSSGNAYQQTASGGAYQQQSSGLYQSYQPRQSAPYGPAQGPDMTKPTATQQDLQGLFDSNIPESMQPLQPLVVNKPQSVPSEDPPKSVAPSMSSLSPPKQVPSKQIPVVPQQKTHQRQDSSASTASLDDILSTSPSIPQKSTHDHMLTPKVLTAQEIEQQKEEAVIKNQLARQTSKDPFSDPLVKDRFVGEVEKLAKYVESLTKTTCSGPTNLDVVWKELIEEQDRGGKKSSMAIARCYPAKNREQDSMPYDENRIILTTLKDDYINASLIVDLSPNCPKFITTQSPLPVTLTDFWVMVYEQGSEVIVMLSSETEKGKKFPEYWPQQKGRTEYHGPITLTLQSVKDKVNWVERIIYLNHSEKKQGRTVVQLQYKNWPISGFPENVSYILQFITEVHSFYKQQRSLLKPVVVHCSNGTGRTGVFMLIYTCMQDIDHGKGVSGIMDVAKKMFKQRRLPIKEKFQLKYAYEAVLFYAQDILAKEGILIKKASFGDKLPHPGEKSNQWTPTEDILFGAMSVSALRTNVAKMGLHAMEPSEEEIGKSQEHLRQDLSENLPDVVQRADKNKGRDQGTETTSDKMEESVDAKPKMVHSESSSSIKSLDSASHRSLDSVSLPSFDSAPESKEGSPFHQSARAGNQLSLADLQNPHTFDLGTSEGKKKITKANFQQKTSGLSGHSSDPSDPLNSLDPLWSLNK
ncbi:tyrosine-protein phosphatase non-receptor type 23-like [Saccostrea echinata]|uniref:tyrosine-protein phosphatase non-receptor type 23-like n=1 Tax=Saccostrea echinata TaxID=191078 RepID=UPI002A7F1AA1|nr:tyrosine-protein phosphatase non-receptor type 23-like [Saccostrea echinata]